MGSSHDEKLQAMWEGLREGLHVAEGTAGCRLFSMSSGGVGISEKTSYFHGVRWGKHWKERDVFVGMQVTPRARSTKPRTRTTSLHELYDPNNMFCGGFMVSSRESMDGKGVVGQKGETKTMLVAGRKFDDTDAEVGEEEGEEVWGISMVNPADVILNE